MCQEEEWAGLVVEGCTPPLTTPSSAVKADSLEEAGTRECLKVRDMIPLALEMTGLVVWEWVGPDFQAGEVVKEGVALVGTEAEGGEEEEVFCKSTMMLVTFSRNHARYELCNITMSHLVQA